MRKKNISKPNKNLIIKYYNFYIRLLFKNFFLGNYENHLCTNIVIETLLSIEKEDWFNYLILGNFTLLTVHFFVESRFKESIMQMSFFMNKSDTHLMCFDSR